MTGEPDLLWNGMHPPHEKEMEQIIGLVSFFPSRVCEQSPLCTKTHTDKHTHAYTPSAQAESGRTWDFYYVCECVCMTAEDYSWGQSKPPNKLNLKSSSQLG